MKARSSGSRYPFPWLAPSGTRVLVERLTLLDDSLLLKLQSVDGWQPVSAQSPPGRKTNPEQLKCLSLAGGTVHQ